MQTTILSYMKMAERFPKGLETLWEKEKLFVTSNFSFSHTVFKRLVLQKRKNQGLFEKELRYSVYGSIYEYILSIHSDEGYI